MNLKKNHNKIEENNLKLIEYKNNQRHPFHLVDPSPWPIIAAVGALGFTLGGVLFFHNYLFGFELLVVGLIIILYVMSTWWRDIVREGTFEGRHTKNVQSGLRLGMVLFIVSEVMFFFAFFWAFFHSSLSPSIDGIVPPIGIDVLNPWQIPLLNTIILLSSGVSITWAHHSIIVGSRKKALLGLTLTILLAILFTVLQGFEYTTAPFSISDSIYGATFYMTTGFHGFQVFIGT